MGNHLVRRALLVLALFALASRGALALQQRREGSRFDAIAVPDPSVAVSPVILPADSPRFPAAVGSGWAAPALAARFVFRSAT